MNERINELIKQSYVTVRSQNDRDVTYFSQEKFAELIVRVCGYHADVFESLGCPQDMDPTETKPSDYIKKHFGVEE
jgi:hypothetical protein